MLQLKMRHFRGRASVGTKIPAGESRSFIQGDIGSAAPGDRDRDRDSAPDPCSITIFRPTLAASIFGQHFQHGGVVRVTR